MTDNVYFIIINDDVDWGCFSTVKLTLVFFKYFVCEEGLWNYEKIPFLFKNIRSFICTQMDSWFPIFAIGCNLLLALYIYLDAQVIAQFGTGSPSKLLLCLFDVSPSFFEHFIMFFLAQKDLSGSY